ncbi:aldo/keto reductase [Amnibacterium setariae]|uniref:NADP-dependent oxidoreductase domain-containing protein n=1 Tax=Amnibacterium setariae TaxID=2306585 RepID=A0A3A1TSP9_9MICO|nr:aldo/keto reductase [Amnibacterium setariae]RIX26091.1 hypothetical protein D1781_17275 [Amnibacterium setariae]
MTTGSEEHHLEIGVGTSTLRSLGRRAPIAAVVRLLETADRAGVRYIDTADTYGAGSAERAIAGAVRRSSALRDSASPFRVITKIGYRTPDLPGPLRLLNQPVKKVVQRGAQQAFDASSLMVAWAGSRRRLAQLDVHACCLHNPSREVLESGDALRVLGRLHARGAFHHVGISVDDISTVDLVSRLDGVGLVELPAEAWTTVAPEVRSRFLNRGTEVVVNRVTALDRDPVVALRALAAGPQPPTVAVVGTRDPDHLVADAEAVRS